MIGQLSSDRFVKSVGTARPRPPYLLDYRVFARPAILIVIALCLLAASASRGQSIPTVSIVLSRMTAHEDETVMAHIFISDVSNLSAADVGISVDDRCLRIMGRPLGTFLPDTDGGSTAFSVMNDHDTRLALAITDRSLLATGGGIFYQVHLLVTCASGTAPLEVTFAELSAYKDPSADPVEIQSYTLYAGNLTIVNAQLQIGPVEEQTQPPPTTTLAITATATPEPVTSQASQALLTTLNTLNIAVIVLLAILILFIVILIAWAARRFFGGVNQ